MAQHFPTVAVFGLGTTGSHLVDLLARGGRQVIAVEVDDTALRRGRERVTATGDGVEFTTDPAHAVRAGLVIEALPERLEAKRGLFARLDADCPPHTVFATTTTGLSVTEIAFATGRTDRTVGLHLFPLDPGREGAAVEVVGTPLTGAALLADLGELIRDLGCLPVPVADRAGFIGGALTMAYLNGAVTMYERRYASRDSIDTAMTLGCGLPRGPLAHLDDMGLDTAHDTLEALYRRTGDPRYVPAPTLTHMVAAGLVGRKAGRGFYAYGAGGAAPIGARSDHTPSAPARPVHRIGVVGSGTMAVGIAEVCARSGRPTVLVARGELRAKEARAAVERSLERGVRRGKLAPEVLGASMDRLSTGCAMDALGACDLVIEAVAEDIDVKRAVFAGLDAVCAPGAVLATSTSSLPVIECAMATGRPEDVVGMHFFNPAPVMKLVEVAHTVLTSAEALGTAHAVAAALGKRAVDCPDRAGFIVNALLFPYLNSAVEMLQEGWASAEEIDTVMTAGQGYPMGPLRLLDVIGLDVSVAIQRALHRTFRAPELTPARHLERLVEAGHLGRKGGKGLHLHDD
ncbi:3-hydroxyacyl-CoA dehydrogenase family protein [Streptomyces sp. NA02950]|uniref:3-hydroxyacyl-CoA dehydrogenase family protein n=1 Tax=Streptomyces sp. NA02950 TaxID=2742137 RepID=UPI0015912BE7|nr:3-hydroxyacyl-CoA dehydrogenase [Streptomyces sp. NA02950]QKV91032.1 3-hydroxyacyl-CoA dehydrogenase family protein [Streptomyces sp. NA02950]